MESQKEKCSNKQHKELEAISYCQECKIYMCNKCIAHHKGLFDNHNEYNIDKNLKEIFIGICQEKNHTNKLEYFCLTHNKLCCANCITKKQGHGNGQHAECYICFVEEIKEEKKNKLNENIKHLEDLSKNLENTLKELNLISEKINEKKNNVKNKIKKVFTAIRNALNEREDELLKDVDIKFDNIYFKENIFRESEKLPNKIKISLERGKNMEKYWNDNKEFLILNECINIENNIRDINIINDKIKKYKINENLKIEFYPQEKIIDDYINQIKNFGCLSNIDSLILNGNDNINKFYNLVNFNLLNNNIKLIYRSTVDGFNYLSIVNKVNNKSNLIFLYLTENKRIFGSYIKTKLENINLNGTRKYFTDNNAFVFSLNNNKKYKILIPQYAIGFDSTYYILFGNNRNSNGFYYCQNVIYDKELISGYKIYDFSKNSELTEGTGKLVELEIFEIV